MGINTALSLGLHEGERMLHVAPLYHSASLDMLLIGGMMYRATHHPAWAARFAQIFPRVGLSIDLGGSWVLPRLVGLRQARELALLGDDVDGERATRIGLITRCVPAHELDTAVDDLARRLAAFSPSAQARAKHLFDATCDDTLDDALHREAAAQVANASTPEFHHALTTFRARPQGAQP